jgi:hypothetical protein
LRRKAAGYSEDNKRCLVEYKRNSALGLKNEKFTEHILKVQRIVYGLTLVELRKTAFKFMERNGIQS